MEKKSRHKSQGGKKMQNKCSEGIKILTLVYCNKTTEYQRQANEKLLKTKMRISKGNPGSVECVKAL